MQIVKLRLLHNPTASAAGLTADDLVGLLVVAGGDGTVERVLADVRGVCAPFGILPMGTANNLAASLGILRTPDELIAELASATTAGEPLGPTIPLDFGVADGPWGRTRFFESVGFGALAAALGPVNAREVASEDKIPEGRRALRRVIRDLPATPVTLSLDDGEAAAEESLLLEIANIGSLGPRLPLSPAVRPGDGCFDVLSLDPRQRGAMLAWLDAPDDCGPAPLTRRRARCVRVRWHDSPSHRDDHFDPPSGSPAKMIASIEPAAVRIRVPQPR